MAFEKHFGHVADAAEFLVQQRVIESQLRQTRHLATVDADEMWVRGIRHLAGEFKPPDVIAQFHP